MTRTTTMIAAVGWWSSSSWLLLLLLLLGYFFALVSTTTNTVGVVVGAASSQQQQQQQQHSSSTSPKNPSLLAAGSSGIVTLPLLPHHVVRQRRLDEAAATAGGGDHVGSFRTKDQQKQQEWMRMHSKYEHEHHRSRRRNLNEPDDAIAADQVAALFQGYGTHYADLWCGTPPQRQTVIVDTGSGVTAFPCTGCDQCGVPDYHIDALFDETASTTFHKLDCNECLKGTCRSGNECGIGMSYAEGSSWNAHEVSDLCYAGGFHNRPMNEKDKNAATADDADPFHAPAFAFTTKFGCQTHVTGLFKTQLADGIMGMDVAASAFWKQMYDAHKIGAEAFSLCFSRKDDAARTGTEAGAMSLGGTDERLHDTPMVYSATQESSGFYVVTVRKVYLRHGGGGTSAVSTDPSISIQPLDISEASLNSGRVIVDSGTTDTYFSRKLQAPFEQAFKAITGESYGHSTKKFTAAELAMQPTILFQLAGDETLNQAVVDAHPGATTVAGLAGDLDPEHPLDVVLAIPPEHYYEYDPDVQGYVARFYADESSGGVLGANSMMGHDVYFDIASFRIGWSESTCDYTALVAEYTDGDWTPPVDPPPDNRIEPSGEEEDDDDEEEEDDDDGSPSHDDATGGATDDEHGAPSGTYEEPGSPFCSTMTCQVAMIAGVVFAVTFGAIRLVRRSPSGPIYEVAENSELELHSGSFVNEARNLEFRDHADEAGGKFT